ncbi:YhgE/Pip domain-containing protein [Corynebacterium pseudodiphtheriticum]|uniref:YhgE/Pip domain-containing protein n=1 Tax=Corynebacterium pseudodiphtheriticum TaxID=37637 RepID=A0AAP4BRV4_9CORY|nr:YhgE/Pip domain-containing protein [Corynebacterium pseudodiphtheriticum]MDK4229076.1 YhgE/Pip domain-containing protein [Corynebacterium pseudodiphtheriticum]MDK4307727.1 YhgE/Pip domain-containing protein [Corynebacterium pseudodiphtheriticum]
MNNILSILRNDLRAIRGNVMTGVIVFGLVIIPLLFTGFNILASWDPFSNTDRLKIAVASKDEGHESDLASLRLNLGDEVLSQLSRNEQVDWVLTNADDALEGTKSGEYYAGIVLPENFSRELLTFYIEGTEPAKLDLYTNEKKNALSTTITERSASGVIERIDESFTRVVTTVGLGVVESLDNYLEEEETQAALDNVANRVENIGTRLNSSAATVRSLANLVDSAIPLAQAADNILRAAGSHAASGTDTGTSSGAGAGAGGGASVGAGADGSSPIDALSATLNDSTGALENSLGATSQAYAALSDQFDELLNNAQAATAQTAQTYRTAAERVAQQTAAFQGVRDALEREVSNLPLPGPVSAGYQQVRAQLDASIAQSNALHDSLTTTADRIESGTDNARQSRQQTQEAIAAARQAVDNARTAYRENLQPQLNTLRGSVNTVVNDIAAVRAEIADVRNTLSSTSGGPESSLLRARDGADRLADTLYEQARRFADLERQFAEVREGGDLSKLTDIIGSDPELLASRISAPVAVERKPVFAVASFGVGMTPFYLALALWVGALLTCVLMRSNAEHKYLSDDGEFTRNQIYLGRVATFLAIGIAQATFAVGGLIFFVQIQPEHPFLLWLSAVLASSVFMLIVHALVIAFDSAGKALAVLLLIVQVSGSGGAYPLPLLPHWFQSVSPWLPATYAIDAFRSAIAGVYQGDIFRDLGMLLLFAIPALVLGLWLRRAMDSYHQRLQKGIRETRVMQ